MPPEFELVRRKVLGALGAIGAASIGGLTLASETNAQRTLPPENDRFVYSVKFICGSIETAEASRNSFEVEPPAKPANYATAINVHNVAGGDLEFTLQGIVAGVEPGDVSGSPVSGEATRQLGPNEAIEIDCPEIADLFDPGDVTRRFVTGFVRIESPERLEVVAVYTNERTIRLSTTPPSDGDDGLAQADREALLRTAATGTSVDVEYVEPYRTRGRGAGPPRTDPNGNDR